MTPDQRIGFSLPDSQAVNRSLRLLTITSLVAMAVRAETAEAYSAEYFFLPGEAGVFQAATGPRAILMNNGDRGNAAYLNFEYCRGEGKNLIPGYGIGYLDGDMHGTTSRYTEDRDGDAWSTPVTKLGVDNSGFWTLVAKGDKYTMIGELCPDSFAMNQPMRARGAGKINQEQLAQSRQDYHDRRHAEAKASVGERLKVKQQDPRRIRLISTPMTA